MKTFLMCVGAQKAGTTWLWHYLRKNPNIDLGFKKEYHVWDSTTIPEYAFFKENLEKAVAEKPTQEKVIQLSFMNNCELYFKYFQRKLQCVNITGDFTPQLSSLDPSTFYYIRTTFQHSNINTRAIFILRDPVDRLQSMIRMKMIIRGMLNPSYDTELALMEEHCQSDNYYLTGGYNQLIPKFDDVFAQNIHYSFFEDLFTDYSTKQITDFLQVPHHKPDYNFNPKLSKTDNKLLPEDREYFESLYKPIYDYTADRFPQVKNLWTYYQK